MVKLKWDAESEFSWQPWGLMVVAVVKLLQAIEWGPQLYSKQVHNQHTNNKIWGISIHSDVRTKTLSIYPKIAWQHASTMRSCSCLLELGLGLISNYIAPKDKFATILTGHATQEILGILEICMKPSEQCVPPRLSTFPETRAVLCQELQHDLDIAG